MAEGRVPAAEADSRVFVAGPAAVDAFHHVLGIPAALRDNGTYRATRVVWNRGALQIDLAGRGFNRAVLRLQPAADASESGSLLDIRTDGPQQGLHPAVEKLLATVRRRLARTPMTGFLELIRRDPATVVESPQLESGGPREGVNLVPKPYVHEWTGKPGELGQWGLFFDDLVFVYTGFTRVSFVLPTTHVMHGNHECLCVTPKIRTRSAWIFNYPRRGTSPTSERVRGRLGLGPQHLDKPFRRLSTDMNELDTVLGGDEKLARAISLAMTGDGDRILGVHKTCLPKVMGDDVERPLAAARKQPGVHCLSYCMGFTHDQSLYAEEREFGNEEAGVIGALLLRPNARPVPNPAAERRFDLVGFPDGADIAELASLVEDCGATLNMLLLPEIDVPVFRRTPRPQVQVRFPNTYYDHLYSTVFDQLADKVIAPPAPFGLHASELWLRAVASGLGLDDDQVNKTLVRIRQDIQARWDELSAIARGLRVGFVVDPRVLPRLVEPARSFGLSMPAMLDEMGFGIDLLCYAPAGDISYATGAATTGNVRLLPFRDEKEMHALLRDGDSRAVYSDRSFERRLSANGKAQFGFGDFELGFRGALRSLERLVRACSLPFYARYARYLGRGAA